MSSLQSDDDRSGEVGHRNLTPDDVVVNFDKFLKLVIDYWFLQDSAEVVRPLLLLLLLLHSLSFPACLPSHPLCLGTFRAACASCSLISAAAIRGTNG